MIQSSKRTKLDDVELFWSSEIIPNHPILFFFDVFL